jgi:hypothetical protein
MCMGCMANADFVMTSGILGAASMRVGARRYLPGGFRRPSKVTDDEVQAFVDSLTPLPVAVPDRVVDLDGAQVLADH